MPEFCDLNLFAPLWSFASFSGSCAHRTGYPARPDGNGAAKTLDFQSWHGACNPFEPPRNSGSKRHAELTMKRKPARPAKVHEEDRGGY